MGTFIRSLGAALGIAGAAACSHAPPDTDVPLEAPIRLRVDNQAFNDMNVYVLSESGQRVRLGTANGHAETMFTLPKYLSRALTTLRFQLDPIGGNRTPVSEQITVSPGEEVVLRVPPAMNHSVRAGLELYSYRLIDRSKSP